MDVDQRKPTSSRNRAGEDLHVAGQDHQVDVAAQQVELPRPPPQRGSPCVAGTWRKGTPNGRTCSARSGWLEITITTDMSNSPRRLRHNRSSRQWSSLDAMIATRLGSAASVSEKSIPNCSATCSVKSRLTRLARRSTREVEDGALHERSAGLCGGMLIQGDDVGPGIGEEPLTAATRPGRSAQRSSNRPISRSDSTGTAEPPWRGAAAAGRSACRVTARASGHHPHAYHTGIGTVAPGELSPAVTGDTVRGMQGSGSGPSASGPRLTRTVDAVRLANRMSPPLDPPPVPPGQQGDAATAMKKAEDALARQSSVTAQLDLHVVGAILSAHAMAVEGSERLRALQDEVEAAVQSRTDLDTPSGARDFQRYLIGKLRQIAAVVESGNLDDTSRAALASAWTALYENARGQRPPESDTLQTSGTAPESAGVAPVAADDPPQPDGVGIADDPLLDSLLAAEQITPGGLMSGPPVSGPAPAVPPLAPANAPMFPMPGITPGMSAAPLTGGTAEWPKPDLSGGPFRPGRSADAGNAELESLFDDGYLPSESDGLPVADILFGDEQADNLSGDYAGADSVTVRIPGGDVVSAPTPAIAEVLRSALAGTPIGEAYRQQGIVVPPPGTAVSHPVDPARIVAGDIGMFTDRQALAVDTHRAWMDGRIQPTTSIGGPSFLGWLHPPAQGTAPSAPPPPAPSPGGPSPTRPAIADAH